MIKTIPNQVILAAFHESGHASTAFHYGHFIKGIEIDAFGSGVLSTKIQEPTYPEEKRFLHKPFTNDHQSEEEYEKALWTLRNDSKNMQFVFLPSCRS